MKAAPCYLEESGVWLKQVTGHERQAYDVLARHADSLQTDDLRLNFSYLLDYDDTNGCATLLHAGNFPEPTVMGYFGQDPVFTTDYLRTMTESFELIRRGIPVAELGGTDYEAREDGVISSLGYLARMGAGVAADRFNALRQEVYGMTMATQAQIEGLPLYASHRDPNPTNYLVSYGSTRTVSIIDWETSGPSRRGYDEGRLMTYLATNRKLREEFSDMTADMLDPTEQLYMWRVTAARSYREILSHIEGRYIARLMLDEGDADVILETMETINCLDALAIQALKKVKRALAQD